MKRALMLAIAVVLALLTAGGPASAAPALTDASPKAEAKLGTAPHIVRLTFDQPVAQGGPYEVVVTGPDGQAWTEAMIGVDENVVTVPLRPLGPVGDYVVNYSVTPPRQSAVAGQYRFTLTKPGPAATDEQRRQAEAIAGGTASLPVWLWVVLGVALVGAVVAGMRLVRSYRG